METGDVRWKFVNLQNGGDIQIVTTERSGTGSCNTATTSISGAASSGWTSPGSWSSIP